MADWAKALPPRNGKRVHISTLYRWTTRGVRGVRLETLPLGGTLATSREALERFFAELARVRSGGADDAPPARPDPIPPSRRAEIAEANRRAREALG